MHGVRCRLVMSIVVTSVILVATNARAQNADAQFAQGEQLMKAGKIAEACEHFDASNRTDPRAGTLIRVGDCRERLHQLASAWTAYKRSRPRRSPSSSHSSRT